MRARGCRSADVALVARRALVALAAAFVLACGDDAGGPQKLALHLDYGAYPGGACGMADDCATVGSCPFDCPQNVGVFLVDATSDAVLDSTCVNLAASGMTAPRRLDDLADALAGISFASGVEFGREVALEIAIYDTPANRTCARPTPTAPPELPMDPGGGLPNFWGRSAPVRIREGENRIDLPVQCVVPPTSCVSATRVTARVDEVVTLLPPLEQAPDLDVRVGLVLLGSEAGASAEFQQGRPLVFADGAPPTWSREFPSALFGSEPCGVGTLVLKATPPLGYPVLSCESVGLGDDGTSGPTLDVRGYFLDRNLVDKLVAGLGATVVPPRGLVVGRVVDEVGNPVAGATVEALTGEIEVVYLTDDFAPHPEGKTTGQAWFAISAPPAFPAPGGLGGELVSPCCGRLIAIREGPDASFGCSPGAVGFVEGTVMATVIDLSDPESCPVLPAP